MRFTDDGPDIPSELFDARDRGDVVFICGAGVSRYSSDLPLFNELVDRIYERLNTESGDSPAEREAYCNKEYDRVLKLLSDRMVGSAFNDALANILAVSDHSTKTQKALLDLSVDAQGRSCLVTTNFDTLFERAKPEIPSSAAAALPAPNSERFHGVMHLHGRLADTEPKLLPTDLVLTSAQFGEAYMRSGWASRFIYDLLRCRHIVLMGYRADDPPMRYLLEVIDADRARFEDLKTAYAFVPYGQAEDKTLSDIKAIWTGRGVKAIPYPADSPQGHAVLYETINAWAEYARNPDEWWDALFRRTAHADPDTLDDLPRSQATECVRREDAARGFAENSPSGKWLKYLDRAERIKPDGTIIKVFHRILDNALDDPDMIAWFAESNLVTETLMDTLERALEQNEDLDDVYRKCWQAILWSREDFRRTRKFAWFRVKKRLENGETNTQIAEKIKEVFTPRLTVAKPFRWPGAEAPRHPPEQVSDIIDIKFAAPDYPTPEKFLQTVPRDAVFLARLCQLFSDSLHSLYERAQDLKDASLLYRLNWDIPSVAEHPQNRHRRGIYPIIRLLADLWEILLTLDREAALGLVENWTRKPANIVIFRRMVLHAAILDSAFDASQAANMLLDLDDTEFWLSIKREVMRLLAERWQDFSQQDRDRLEERILQGPQRDLFIYKIEDAEFEEISDRDIFIRLSRILNAGGVLSDKAHEKMEDILARHPKWQAGPDDRDDFSSWHTFSIGYKGDPSPLDEVPIEELLQKAEEISNNINNTDVWRIYINKAPQRCFEALKLASNDGHWPDSFWQGFLNEAFSVNRNADFDQTLFSELIDLFQDAPIDIQIKWGFLLTNNFFHHHSDWEEGDKNKKLEIWDWLWSLLWLPPVMQEVSEPMCM